MMSVVQVNYQTWEYRFKTLKQKMKNLHIELDKVAHNNVSRINDLRELTKCLRIYANGNFSFFRDGFDQQAQKHNQLTVTNKYSPEHGFRSVIHQGFEDTKLFEHIFNQRSSTNNTLLTALNSTDKLAWDALQPAINAMLVPENTIILTYFHKIASIRIIPYAPVALIGIPFTALDEPVDLLAIPHEVGHYVFRRATKPATYYDENADEMKGYERPLRNIIHRRILNESKYIQAWSEEVFADIYGCLIAGPAIALDFQDLQLDFAIKRFVMNDGLHPSPILRPYIYTDVLNNVSPQWANSLESLWEQRRNERETGKPVAEKGKFETRGGAKPITSVFPKAGRSNFQRVLGFISDQLALNQHLGAATWWTTFRDKGFVELGSNQKAIQSTLYNPFQDEFFDRDANGNLTSWKVNPAPRLPALPVRNIPLHDLADFAEYDTVIDVNNEIDNNVLEGILAEWPKPFFPDHPRPVKDEYRREHVENGEINKTIWWVWDVLFRAGWNTFGNGDWVKGP